MFPLSISLTRLFFRYIHLEGQQGLLLTLVMMLLILFLSTKLFFSYIHLEGQQELLLTLVMMLLILFLSTKGMLCRTPLAIFH